MQGAGQRQEEGQDRSLFSSHCVYFAGQCMNIFQTAAGLCVCLVLAERREVLLELLPCCPAEFLCSGPGHWGALGAEAADAQE